MRLAKYIWIILLALLSQRTTAQELCGINNNSFRAGERLVFHVYYNVSFIWAHAGDAVFTIANDNFRGNSVYHVVGTGTTINSYDFFFKVRDRYESFIDKETLTPLRFYRNVNEGGVKFKNDVSFDRNTGKATSLNGTYNVPNCTQDVLSTIYYARNINYNKYKAGDKIFFNLFLDDKVYPIYIRYMGKERITTKYGTFNTIKITPLLIKGTIFEGGEKMIVWVSDDANHVPVRIESPILVGSIKVDLMGFDNLKNPMTALVSKSN
jgi:hypothetical protein